MTLFTQTIVRHWAMQGLMVATLAFGGADLATRLAVNQGTVRAKVAEAVRRSTPTFDHGTAALGISLAAAGGRYALN